MFKSVVTICVMGGLAAALSGCASSSSAGAVAPVDDALAVVTQDGWYYDYDGSVIKPYEETQIATLEERQAMSVACKDFTITAIEVLPNGKFGAIEFKAIPGLDMQNGDSMTCKALIVDRASGEVVIDFGLQNEDCCEMLIEMLGGVIRMSCSGTCDNGESCALESAMAGDISTFTCECPDVP